MKKYKIIIEEHVSEEFTVEAENMEEALNKAENNYYKGEFVLEPGNVVNRLISGKAIDGKEYTEWTEF